MNLVSQVQLFLHSNVPVKFFVWNLQSLIVLYSVLRAVRAFFIILILIIIHATSPRRW